VVLSPSRQLLVVTTADWPAVEGRLYRFERSAAGDPWRPVGESVPVVVGRGGLGWGVGLYDAAGAAGPVKREGDGRSPAGMYALGVAFGFADAVPSALGYHRLTAATECVDDSRSVYYNSLVERNRAAAIDWSSSERMRAIEPEYRLGVFVDHNVPAQPGRGSCIFLHIWKGPTSPTDGCTAMPDTSLAEIVAWLTPRPPPILVQLPRAEYDQRRQTWGLPSLPLP
jgi:zinc D-Ala-D-Ala dipeptidase